MFEDTGRCLRRTRSHLRPHGPDFPHISERFLQQSAASSENSVLSGREGENEANNQGNPVLSGPPSNSEQDTAVDFVSYAPAERAITFNDNAVAGTRYNSIKATRHTTRTKTTSHSNSFPPDDSSHQCHSKAGACQSSERRIMTMCLILDCLPIAVQLTPVAHRRAALAPCQPRGPMRQQIRPPARPVAVLQAAMAQTAHQVPHRLQDGPVSHVLRKLCQPRFQVDHLHHLWQIAPWK